MKNEKSFVLKILESILYKNLIEHLIILSKHPKTKKILLKEFKLRNKATKKFYKKYTNYSYPNVDIHQTENCNDVNSLNFIKKFNPDLTLIWGTGIIKKPIILSSRYMINCHFSRLPYYKGSFSEFWIFYHKDFEKSGITFHLVTEKLDGGDIIKFIHNDCKTDPFEMRYKNIELLLNNVNTLICDYINNKMKLSPQKSLSQKHTFKFSDIKIEHKERVYLQIK